MVSGFALLKTLLKVLLQLGTLPLSFFQSLFLQIVPLRQPAFLRFLSYFVLLLRRYLHMAGELHCITCITLPNNAEFKKHTQKVLFITCLFINSSEELYKSGFRCEMVSSGKFINILLRDFHNCQYVFLLSIKVTLHVFGERLPVPFLMLLF